MGKVAALPIVGMMMTECAGAGVIILSKAAMSTGMSNLIFVFYSNALAALILLPTSLAFHRSRPPLTFSVLCWFFLLGLIGFVAQFVGYAGINYSSPTLGTAMLNLLPAFTFILAVIFRSRPPLITHPTLWGYLFYFVSVEAILACFSILLGKLSTRRMETVDWRSSSTLAKSLGTMLSISGAFIVTLYKGPALLLTSSTDILSYKQLFSQQSNWVIGGILLLVYCVLASSSYIIQASVIKKYPAELIMVFYYCFFVAIQAVVVSLIVETDLSAWSLKPKMRLIAVVYSAVFGSTFTIGVTTWCLHRAGPVFIAMFKPLGIIVAVSIGVTFVGDTFYLGSLVGAIVIVIGFYSVMWGKANEEKMDGGAETKSLATSNQRVPLLQNTLEEI